MRIKKNTIVALSILGLFIIGTVVTVRISKDASIVNFINERNELCGNMSVLLTAEEDIDECFCYFEGFKTGDQSIDDITLPLCACECMVNGTVVKIGLIESQA
jgi:hypothetical protein